MAEEGEKLQIKPGVVATYMSNFKMSADGENFTFTELIMQNKRIEQLNKAIEEAKEVHVIDLSFNNIADINPLKEMSNLVKIDISRNKVKSLALFT